MNKNDILEKAKEMSKKVSYEIIVYENDWGEWLIISEFEYSKVVGGSEIIAIYENGKEVNL